MEKKVYLTSDINLASTLLAIGHDVDGINPSNPREVIFIFNKDKKTPNGVDIEDNVSSYWNGNLLVDAKSLFSSRRDLLNRIREAGRQEGSNYD